MSSRKWLENQHHPMHLSPPYPFKTNIEEVEDLHEVDNIVNSMENVP